MRRDINSRHKTRYSRKLPSAHIKFYCTQNSPLYSIVIFHDKANKLEYHEREAEFHPSHKIQQSIQYIHDGKSIKIDCIQIRKFQRMNVVNSSMRKQKYHQSRIVSKVSQVTILYKQYRTINE